MSEAIVFSYFVPVDLAGLVLAAAVAVISEPVGLLAMIIVGGGALARWLP
jgi:hypothetical protein